MNADLSGYTLLVVDDHADALYILTRVFEHCGARVIGTRNTEEARHVLEGEAPDLIVTDINLPRETGTEFARWIRTHAPARRTTIPIVGLTATAQTLSGPPDPAFTAYLEKPVEFEALCQQIAEILRAPDTT